MCPCSADAPPADAPGARRPRPAPRGLRLACLLAIAAVVLLLARVGATRIAGRGPDFEYFYQAGASLLARGALDPGYDVVAGRVAARGTLDWYWPFVPRVMTLLAVLPFEAAGAVWLGLNLAALLATVRMLGRHVSGLPPADWTVTQLLPLLALAVYWRWEFRLNQINALTLLLIVASFVHWQQGRRALGGFWLGLATLLKLTPGLLIAWLALKRQYRVVGAAALTVALAGPAGDAAVFGPRTALELYRGWADRAVRDGSHRGLVLAQREMDWRNQGLGAVLSRWLHPTNYNTHFDNDPRHQELYGAPAARTLHLVALPRTTVAGLATAATLLSLAGLAWFLRKPAAVLGTWQLRLEWALVLLAMLWLMPVMRRYHMIWALPALSVLGGALHYAGPRRPWTWVALACIAAAVLAELSLLSMPLEAAGAILASVALLALPIIALLARLARDPAALPRPVPAPPAPTASTAAGVPRPAGSGQAPAGAHA